MSSPETIFAAHMTCRRCLLLSRSVCLHSGMKFTLHVADQSCPIGKHKNMAVIGTKTAITPEAAAKSAEPGKDAEVILQKDGIYELLDELGAHRVAMALRLMDASGCAGCREESRRLSAKYPRLGQVAAGITAWLRKVKP